MLTAVARKEIARAGGRGRNVRSTYCETGLVHKGGTAVPRLDLVPEDDLDLAVVLAAWGEGRAEDALDRVRKLGGERADVVHCVRSVSVVLSRSVGRPHIQNTSIVCGASYLPAMTRA